MQCMVPKRGQYPWVILRYGGVVDVLGGPPRWRQDLWPRTYGARARVETLGPTLGDYPPCGAWGALLLWRIPCNKNTVVSAHTHTHTLLQSARTDGRWIIPGVPKACHEICIPVHFNGI